MRSLMLSERNIFHIEMQSHRAKFADSFIPLRVNSADYFVREHAMVLFSRFNSYYTPASVRLWRGKHGATAVHDKMAPELSSEGYRIDNPAELLFARRSLESRGTEPLIPRYTLPRYLGRLLISFPRVCHQTKRGIDRSTAIPIAERKTAKRATPRHQLRMTQYLCAPRPPSSRLILLPVYLLPLFFNIREKAKAEGELREGSGNRSFFSPFFFLLFRWPRNH